MSPTPTHPVAGTTRRVVSVLRDRSGMTTAEYAIGTVAAAGIAGLLVRLLTSEPVQELLSNIIIRALTLVFA